MTLQIGLVLSPGPNTSCVVIYLQPGITILQLPTYIEITLYFLMRVHIYKHPSNKVIDMYKYIY